MRVSTEPDAIAVQDGLDATRRLRMALAVAEHSNAGLIDEGLCHPELRVTSVPGVAPLRGFAGLEDARSFFPEAAAHGLRVQAAVRGAHVTEAGNVLASGSIFLTSDGGCTDENAAWFVYRFRDGLVSAVETYLHEHLALEAAAR